MFRKNSKKNMEYKSRLEDKMCLARENPEPIFDLTDCGLKSVPHGVYSLCRVFLKEVLLLGSNRLTDLKGGGSLQDLKQIMILDLHQNNFTTIPEDIHELTNLMELDLSDNHLKSLPETITQLRKLRKLNLSNNSLCKLPETIGNLISLEYLNIENNKKLNKLPKSLCGNKKLSNILLDSNNFTYPPSDICVQGTEAIMKYIQEDCGIPYDPQIIREELIEIESSISRDIDHSERLQAKLTQLEKIKMQKQQEFLDIERNNELMQRQEIEVQNAMKENKTKLLNDVLDQQIKLDSELTRLQKEKDVERQNLIETLQEEEKNAENAVKYLLVLKDKPVNQLLIQEKHDKAKLFETIIYSENIKKNDILEKMQQTLQEEYKQFKQYDENRTETAKSILSQELEAETNLSNLLKSQGKEQAGLVDTLQRDSDLQKAAVAALLERSDARTWGLVQQVRLVEAQLAHLTALEIDKRKHEVDSQLNDLSQQRVDLSMLLLDLYSQKCERQSELMATIRELQDIEDGNEEDFWLLQYQRLYERCPEMIQGVERNLDPLLLERLLFAGVIYCVPFLAQWAHSIETLSNLTDHNLMEVGIVKSEDRHKVLEAIKSYAKLHSKLKDEEDTRPGSATASPEPKTKASAPYESQSSIRETECVICMDHPCQIIFIPCGHMCSCIGCSKLIDSCPICRGDIEQKIQVILP